MTFVGWLSKFDKDPNVQDATGKKAFACGYAAALEEAIERIPPSKAHTILANMVEEVKAELSGTAPRNGRIIRP